MSNQLTEEKRAIQTMKLDTRHDRIKLFKEHFLSNPQSAATLSLNRVWTILEKSSWNFTIHVYILKGVSLKEIFASDNDDSEHKADVVLFLVKK